MAERNLLLRILSAVVGLPLVAALVFWRETLGLAILCLVVVAVGLSEYGGLALRGAPARLRVAMVVVGTAVAAGLYFRPEQGLAWSMGAVVTLGLVTVWKPADLPAAAAQLGMAGFGVFYVGLLVALPLLHRELPEGPLWVAAAVGVTFANDSGAYAFGRTLGRHKLAPTISPGKTVEGAIGGLLCGIAFLLIARATFFPVLTVVDAVAIGAAGGVLGPAGDLMESLLKRAVGAKDSGRLIPGHGGVLDRIDALLFVGAYVYFHARFLR